MDLFSTHEFPADPARVIEAMLDPAFYAILALPDLEPPDVLERTEDGDTVVLRVGYAYTGTLDPIARTVLGTDRITWVQSLTMDRSQHHGELTIIPGVQADRVHCSGKVSFAAGDGTTNRTIAGEFKIGIPLVGGRAEKAIAPGILRRLDAEAIALTDYLNR